MRRLRVTGIDRLRTDKLWRGMELTHSITETRENRIKYYRHVDRMSVIHSTDVP